MKVLILILIMVVSSNCRSQTTSLATFKSDPSGNEMSKFLSVQTRKLPRPEKEEIFFQEPYAFSVILSLIVDKDGNLKDINILESSSSKAFDTFAINIFKQTSGSWTISKSVSGDIELIIPFRQFVYLNIPNEQKELLDISLKNRNINLLNSPNEICSSASCVVLEEVEHVVSEPIR